VERQDEAASSVTSCLPPPLFFFCGLNSFMACVHFIGEIRGAVIDCALGIAVCVRV
jgi:hypothetical protein